MLTQNTTTFMIIFALLITLCACGPSERDKELERYKELMTQGDKWGQELRSMAKESRQTLSHACVGKLSAGETSSVVGYVAEMAQEASDTNFAYPQKTAVVCSASNTLMSVDIERAIKDPEKPLERLGTPRYVVVTTEREVQMPALPAPNKYKRPAGAEHKGGGSFATLYVGIFDWQSKKLMCSGHARASMPEKFTTVGVGRGQQAAEKDAHTAWAVSIGAMAALSSEIEHIGIQQICNQISPDLCKAVERSKP